MGGKLLIHQINSGILQRVNDKYIMDAISCQSFSLATIRRINYCRMYLRVERLSDIVTNDGLRIQSRYFHGTKRNPFTNKEWPHQNCPSSRSWKEWRAALLTTLDANYRLLVLLNKWINIDSTPRLWYNTTRKKV